MLHEQDSGFQSGIRASPRFLRLLRCKARQKWDAAFEKLLLCGFIGLASFPVLYMCRSSDTNRLVSWRWVLPREDFFYIFISFFQLVCLAHVFVRFCSLTRIHTSIFFLIGSAVVIPLWTSPEMLLDSGRYFLAASHLETNGIAAYLSGWGTDIRPWTDLPASAFFYGLVRRWVGTFQVAYQAFNTFLFCLTIVLTCLAGTRLFDRKIGRYGACLLMASPFLLILVPQHLNDIHVMFLLMLYFYTLLHLRDRDHQYWVWFTALSFLLLAFSKYTAWPIIALLSVLSFFIGPGAMGLSRKKILYSHGVGVIVLMFLVWWKVEVFIGQIELLTLFQVDGLKSWKESYFSTFFFQVNPFVSLFALAGCIGAFIEKNRRFMMIAWFPFLALLLSMERSRYLVPFFPFLALMAAYGLNSVRDKIVRDYAVILMVFFSLMLVYGAYLPFLRSTSMMNLKRAGEFLNAHPAQHFTLITLPQSESRGSTLAAVPILDLYTTKRLYLSSKSDVTGTADPDRYTHSLQFTHLLPLTNYVSNTRVAENPLVVIHDGSDSSTAEAWTSSGRILKQFDQTTGIFKYKTVLTVAELKR